jgi:hypothetical protein
LLVGLFCCIVNRYRTGNNEAPTTTAGAYSIIEEMGGTQTRTILPKSYHSRYKPLPRDKQSYQNPTGAYKKVVYWTYKIAQYTTEINMPEAYGAEG